MPKRGTEVGDRLLELRALGGEAVELGGDLAPRDLCRGDPLLQACDLGSGARADIFDLAGEAIALRSEVGALIFRRCDPFLQTGRLLPHLPEFADQAIAVRSKRFPVPSGLLGPRLRGGARAVCRSDPFLEARHVLARLAELAG